MAGPDINYVDGVGGLLRDEIGVVRGFFVYLSPPQLICWERERERIPIVLLFI